MSYFIIIVQMLSGRSVNYSAKAGQKHPSDEPFVCVWRVGGRTSSEKINTSSASLFAIAILPQNIQPRKIMCQAKVKHQIILPLTFSSEQDRTNQQSKSVYYLQTSKNYIRMKRRREVSVRLSQQNDILGHKLIKFPLGRDHPTLH